MKAQAGSWVREGSWRGGQGADYRWTQYPEVKGTVATTLGKLPLELIQTCGHLSSRLLSAWKDRAVAGEGSGSPQREEPASSLSHLCNLY